MWSGDSSWPLRGYPSFIHHFHKCNIKSAKIFAGAYKLSGIKPIENTVKFFDSEIDELQITGNFTTLTFDNTKVNNFFNPHDYWHRRLVSLGQTEQSAGNDRRRVGLAVPCLGLFITTYANIFYYYSGMVIPKAAEAAIWLAMLIYGHHDEQAVRKVKKQ